MTTRGTKLPGLAELPALLRSLVLPMFADHVLRGVDETLLSAYTSILGDILFWVGVP